MNKLKMQTPNLVDKNVEQIAGLFPEVITEIKDKEGNIIKGIDFDLLKQKLSHVLVEEDNERYRLDWPGKKASLLKANTPITKTLRPVEGESVNFDITENLYIEGDNFEVLKILQESYLGIVKMIYFDPPYNTGKDFIYKDVFNVAEKEYEEEIGVLDDEGGRLFKNTDTNGRFHSDWLSMMYERLVVSKDLLADEGVIFISIDDNEVHNLKKICDEVFGEENFIGGFVINSTPNGRDYGHIAKTHEFCLFYSKNIECCVTNLLQDSTKDFKYSDEIGGFNVHPLYNSNEAFHKGNRPNLYYRFYLYKDRPIKELGDEFYEIGFEKKDNSIEIYPPLSQKNKVPFVWRWGKDKSQNNMNKEIVGYRTNSMEYRVVQKMRTDEKLIRTLLLQKEFTSRRGTAEVEEILNGKYFSFPKPIKLIEEFIKVGTQPDSIVMDIFSGSATSAHAVMQLNAVDNGNRKFVMVQLPEKTDDKSEAYKAGYKTIADIGKERIRRAGKKIQEEYLDKYIRELEKTNKELAQESLLENEELKEQKLELESKVEHVKNLDIGFRVYKTDSSNMKDVFYHPTDIKQEQLSTFVSNIKEDRTPEDLLTQVMLDLGLELSLSIDNREILGNNVFVVQENALVACFDDNINFGIVDVIADLKPFKVVFKDAGFADDKDRINVEERFKRLSPETVITVI